jgi:hypothetical protein
MRQSLPPLAHMRTVLRFGMTRDEFFAACDDLMENYQLRVGSPTLDMNLVSIAVEEGDQLLCFIGDGTLVYVEYRGGVFLDAENSSPDGPPGPPRTALRELLDRARALIRGRRGKQ